MSAYKLTRPSRYYCPQCDLIVGESPCDVCGYTAVVELKPLSDDEDEKADETPGG